MIIINIDGQISVKPREKKNFLIIKIGKPDILCVGYEI